MSNRTSEQALKDARPAYNAWCDRKPIEYRRDGYDQWNRYTPEPGQERPNFHGEELHWRPAQENPTEPSQPRTPQQAMRDARESGAVEAWENGSPIEWRLERDDRWDEYNDSSLPNFYAFGIHWRPKASEPPKPVALDWRPVSEPPEEGDELLAYAHNDKKWMYVRWLKGYEGYYTAWAPQPLPPEVPGGSK